MKRRQFNDTFKIEALTKAETETIPVVAKQLQVAPSLLYYWKRKLKPQSKTNNQAQTVEIPMSLFIELLKSWNGNKLTAA